MELHFKETEAEVREAGSQALERDWAGSACSCAATPPGASRERITHTNSRVMVALFAPLGSLLF